MSSEPRKRLDQEQVLSTAEAVVDRDGWPELTMGAGPASSVAVPSLYRHVRSLEALRGINADDPGARCQPRAQGHGPSGETAMRALATTFRRFALEHPYRCPGWP